MKEVLDRCYYCHSELKYEISETAVYEFSRNHEYVVKHDPYPDCTKCNHRFSAEPYQDEKTSAFIKFLNSIHLKKAEIEYKDMIQYVDDILKFRPE